MKNFGSLKTKLLKKLTDSYIKNNKSEIKQMLDTIKENKDFKELYLLYEDIENKEIEDVDIAKLYVDEVSSQLKNIKNINLSDIVNKLNENLKDINVEEKNEIYEMLDLLSESDSLLNIDKKISVKKNLVEFLTKKKNKDIVETEFTPNQNILNAVLVNGFNTIFDNSLNEDEKKELKDILSLNDVEVKDKINDLKEGLLFKIDSTILESKDNLDLITKLNNVKSEVIKMKNTKHNLFRLKELKNGLD